MGFSAVTAHQRIAAHAWVHANDTAIAVKSLSPAKIYPGVL